MKYAKLSLNCLRSISGAISLIRHEKEYENISSLRLTEHFLYYHEEGDLKISNEEEESHNLVPGDVFFLFANTKYPSHKPTSKRYRSIKIYFQNDPQDLVLNEKTKDGKNEVTIPWLIRTGEGPEILKLFQELVLRNNSSNPLNQKEAGILLNLLILKLSKKTIREPLLDQKISKVKEIIESNAMKKISIDELTEEMVMSRSTLMSHFKKFTGMTIAKYHLELRMRNACHLIKMEPRIRLKELSNLLGFYDEYHFGRTFKSHMGMTVGEFKRQFFHNRIEPER